MTTHVPIDVLFQRPARRVHRAGPRPRRAAVEDVLNSPGFTHGVETLSARLGRSSAEVMTDARAYLDEMASEQRRLVVDLWAWWARRIYSGAYRLQVDDAALDRVRELGGRHPLVFLPSHRSNLDPYVLAALLHDNGLPQNRTLGGINMAFWPIGPLGRRVGVVFIRRSFRDNEVYRFVLKRYLGDLVSKRFNLEWYIEGGRSRTGKLLPPRLGLLNYLIDAVEELGLEDVMLVPTSIVYDLLHEARDMTAESKGRTKDREGLGWLMRYARMQRGDLGSAHVTFGEPVNLAEALRTLEPTTDHSGGPSRVVRSKIAFEVCVRINRATLITAPALLLFALLGVEDRALTFSEVQAVVKPALSYAAVRKISLDTAARDLTSAGGVKRTLDFLVQHRLVECFDEGRDPVYRIGPEHELVAAFYRNSIIHWFVSRAILELALLRVTQLEADDDPIEVAWSEALRLRDLLKFEFFFPEKTEFREELVAELRLIDPSWERRDRDGLGGIGRALMASGMLVAHRTLRSFVEAYSIVGDHLEALGSRAADPETVVRECLALGRQYLMQRQVTSSEAVSAHLFRTALKLADHRELLSGGDAVQCARQELATELREVLQRIVMIHDLDRQRAR
jgi:glycerol-3-phosphate O-acyltransferase